MRRLLCGFVSLLTACSTAAAADPSGIVELQKAFERPPADSRPMMRWWWFGAAVTKPELEKEMRQMREGGIGGFEVQPVYPLALDDPENGFRNLPYLSPEYLEALRFAAEKAKELGLRMDITLGSGWPFGGPHTPVTQAAGRLRFERVTASAKACSLAVPETGAGEKLIVAFLAHGDGSNLNQGDLKPVPVTGSRVDIPCDRNEAQTVLFFIGSRTGMQVKRPAIGAEGFVLDHYDRNAIETHLKNVGEPLLKALGPNPPYSVFSDSLEVFASDWTGDLIQEFKKRRGYDLTPYLPALVGDFGPQTGSVRNDWGLTLTELTEERYLTPIREWAQKHGTRFRSQTYGTPPVTLSSNALVDLPEGEGPRWRSFAATRWAASASHLYGRPVTSSETWTWLHSPAFRATPLDMKAEADLHFLQGVNQLVGHGWPYSPEMAGEPGWRFYAAAVFNRHNPWWIVMPDVTAYLQRISYALRQGKPANDVAIYLPTADARARFTLGKDTVDRSMEGLLGQTLIPQILDAGYNFDFIDDQAIGAVGIPYGALVLPGVERMPLETLRKIQAYVKKGGVVVATRRLPSLAPGLMEADRDTPQVQELAKGMFQGQSAAGHFLTDEQSLGAALAKLLQPDTETSPRTPELGFVHRKLAYADLYFIANTGNRAVHTSVNFRVAGMQPEWWDPFTGKQWAATAAGSARATSVRVDLEAYDSRVLVFSSQKPAAPSMTSPGADAVSTDISSGWQVTFTGLGKTVRMNQLRSWSSDPSTQFYSGEAVYERIVSVPNEAVQPGRRLALSFGAGTEMPAQPAGRPGMRAALESPVAEAGVVYVNGKVAGSVWRPPFEVDITGLAHPGENSIRVVVANTGINALAGQKLPDYKLLNLRYGLRFEAQDMTNLQPLPSGLKGPVALVSR